MSYTIRVFIAGMAIFSMFFGGGNLTFPLWVGSQTSSILLSSLGFVLSGVLLPFLGIFLILAFNGDYERCLGTFGKKFGQLLAFTLLLFWIPFGSGPRCNQLAYGAYCCHISSTLPLWLFSLFYSVVVYTLTFCKKTFLDVLGKVITPILVLSLFALVIAGILNFDSKAVTMNYFQWRDFCDSFVAGYSTMDFVAAIFFSAAVISILKEKEKEKFNIRFVRDACIFAIALLSIIYVGMITLGYMHGDIISYAPRDQLMTLIGRAVFDVRFQVFIYIIVTLSVLSTSMALALVLSDYLKTIFKMDHKISLFLSIFSSFAISIIGFERLATLITFAMSILYPLLLLVALFAFFKKFKSRFSSSI